MCVYIGGGEAMPLVEKCDLNTLINQLNEKHSLIP